VFKNQQFNQAGLGTTLLPSRLLQQSLGFWADSHHEWDEFVWFHVEHYDTNMIAF